MNGKASRCLSLTGCVRALAARCFARLEEDQLAVLLQKLAPLLQLSATTASEEVNF